MTEESVSSGPLDVETLETLAHRADSHPLVAGWQFEPDSISPRRVRIHLDPDQYPSAVEAVRLDIRWYLSGDYTAHYGEIRADAQWQCRWDRHPKSGAPREHFHPPPGADSTVDPSPLEQTHHLGLIFEILDWIEERLEALHRE